jgi:hypothetical protein
MGRGGELGNFEIFAQSLAKKLRSPSRKVVLQNVERRASFFDYLYAPPFAHADKIIELHVFAHSIGGGLFLAYGDPTVALGRVATFDKAQALGRRVTYDEVLAAEYGSILTDDLVRPPFDGMRGAIDARFDANATAKLWGCNSAIRGWVYSDNGVTDAASTAVPYYWRALNERRVPKPSVAQALATYLKRTVYGASSGSHIEVLHNGHWITSERYRTGLGRWPSGSLVHRLSPDRGSYDPYVP